MLPPASPDPAFPTPDAAPRDEARRAGLLAHLVTHLGTEYEVLTEKVSFGIRLDLYLFAPTERFPHLTLATAGISDLPMTTPLEGSSDRLELLIGLPPGWPGLDPLDKDLLADPENFWPVRMVKEVARIPSAHDTFLSWGHTVQDQDHAMFPEGSRFAGVLIGPPVGYPGAIMRAPSEAGDTTFLSLFPLTTPELDYRRAVSGGGDSLVDRIFEQGATSVVDVDREPIVEGPPPYAAAVLLTERPDNLSQAVAHALPNWAAQLAQDDLDEAVFTPEEAHMRLRATTAATEEALLSRTRPDLLSDDARSVVAEHRGEVWVLPVVAGSGDPVTELFGWVDLLLERDDALGVWLPHQRRVLTTAEFARAKEREPLVLASVHATQAPDGSAAATTSGLAGIGGQELWLQDPDVSAASMIKRVRAALEEGSDDTGVPPQAGRFVRYGTTWYRLEEGENPAGEPVLVLTESQNPKKSGLDRDGAPLTDQKPARRGLFRRRG